MLGPVFRGYDPDTDRVVAIKAFFLDLVPELAAEVASDLDRLRSVKIAHPFIITPFGAGADGSIVYFVQEYFVADSADVALKQYGPPPLPDGLRLIGQLAGAIDAADAAGVHHGALHLRDVLVAPHEMRLTGLGVVPALERAGYRAQPRRPYAAPERMAGQPATRASDVFSLACLSFELLTGRRPLPSGDSVTVDTSAIQAADAPALSEVFARVLSATPDDRHPSALEFAAALKHALTGAPLQAGAEAEPSKPRKAARPRKVALLPFDEEPTPPPAESAPVATVVDAPAVVAVAEPLAAPPAAPVETAIEEPVVAAHSEPPTAPMAAGLEEAGVAVAAPDPAVVAEPEMIVAAPEPAIVAEPEMIVAAPEPVIVAEPEMVVAAPEPAIVAEPKMIVAAPEPAVSADVELTADEEAIAETERERSEAAPPVGVPIAEPAIRAATPAQFDEAEFATREAASEPESEPSLIPPEGSTPEAGEFEERTFSTYSDERDAEPLVAAPRRRLAPLLVMLAVGLVVGFGAGYMVAPRGASDPAVASPAVTPSAPRPSASTAPSSQSPAQPAAPANPTASSGPPFIAGGQANTAARAAAKPSAPAKAAARGTLVVASKPSGARVFIDGRDGGKTPLTLRDVKPGSRKVRLELSGYRPWSSTVRVTAGGQRKITASLERRPGG